MNAFILVIIGFALVLSAFAGRKDINLSGDAVEHHLAPEHLFGRQENEIMEDEAFRFKRRDKRAVQNLLLKVFVVIDYSLYQRWLELGGNDVNKTIANIRYFYAHVINGVSKKYSSIDTGSFTYKVALTGYYIIQTLNQSSFTESQDVKTEDPDVLSFEKVLKKMEPWVAERAGVIKNYGVVAAFTTYRDISATGMGYVGRACTGGGVSVTHSGMLYPTINIAAHEIGHNLGSKHDGDGNDCDPMQYYLMTPVLTKSNITNYHTFSRCSRDYFEKYITSLNSTLKENCFRVEATPMDDEVKKYLAELPGQRFTPDQSCQLQYGPDSYYCSDGAKAYLKVCQDIMCFNPKDNHCYGYADGWGLEGTSCGNKSWCLNQQCVFDDRAPVIKDYCMFGETKSPVTFNNVKYVCSDLLKKPSLCYSDFFEEYCCKTCSNLAINGSADCKYGDRSQNMTYGTKTFTCADILVDTGFCYQDYYRGICCNTCQTISTKINSTTCPYGDRIYSITQGSETLTCPDLKKYPYLCYDTNRKSKCCKTCEEIKGNTLGCEYGDKATYCQSYVEKNGQNTCNTVADIKSNCCKTCASV